MRLERLPCRGDARTRALVSRTAPTLSPAAPTHATAGGLTADPTEVPWFVNDPGRYDVDSDVSALLPEGICDWTRGLYTDYADHDLKQTKKVIRTMKDRTTTVDFALPVTVLKIILWPTRLRRPHVNFEGIGLGEHPTLQFRAQSTRKEFDSSMKKT